jgi:hypothetical protein
VTTNKKGGREGTKNISKLLDDHTKKCQATMNVVSFEEGLIFLSFTLLS